MGVVATTVIYELALRRFHDVWVLSKVEESLVPKAAAYGLTGIENSISLRDLFDRLQGGDELLWLETFMIDMENWQGDLCEAVERRGITAKLLVIEPDEPSCAGYRANELRSPRFPKTEDAFREDARSYVKKWQWVAAENPAICGKIVIRKYRDLPGIPMYIIRRKGQVVAGYTGFFLKNPSFSEPHLVWTGRHGGFLEKFCEYFDSKWDANAGNEVKLCS